VRRKNKIVLVLGIVLSITILVSSMGTAKTTLTFWTIYGAGPYKTWTDKMIKEYEELHPDVEIKSTYVAFTIAGEFQQKLQASIVGGVTPDIFTFSGARMYAAFGATKALDEYIAKDPEVSNQDFAPHQLKRAVWEGKVYALPAWNDANSMLWWNKDRFFQAGLDPDTPPQTWDGMKDYSQKLIKKDSKGKIEQLGFIPTYAMGLFYSYLYMAGGTLWTDDIPPKVTANDEKGVMALQFMVDLTDLNGGVKQQAAFSEGFQTGAQSPFYTGQVAMMLTGNWELNQIKKNAPKLRYGVALSPAPEGGVRGGSISGGFSYSISEQSEHSDEAWEFVKYMASSEVQMDMCKTFPGTLPARVALFDDPWFSENPRYPEFKVFVDTLRNAGFPGEAPWGAEAARVLLFEARDEALYHRKTAKQALDDAAVIVTEAINRYYEAHPYESK